MIRGGGGVPTLVLNLDARARRGKQEGKGTHGAPANIYSQVVAPPRLARPMWHDQAYHIISIHLAPSPHVNMGT
jgi:hypothetical protein